MKILIIEDNQLMALFLSSALKKAGHTVQMAYDGENGLDLAFHEKFDAAILDVKLPGIDGFTVLERLRKSSVTATLPIIILSACNDSSDRIHGLELGADDYLPKPFLMDELIARLSAITRRAHAATAGTILAIDNLVLDTVKRKVNCGETQIPLTALEFRLLEYLMRNRGHVITKATLLSQVWDYNFKPKTNIIEARICKLREKLGEHGSLIRNMKGIGYTIN